MVALTVAIPGAGTFSVLSLKVAPVVPGFITLHVIVLLVALAGATVPDSASGIPVERSCSVAIKVGRIYDQYLSYPRISNYAYRTCQNWFLSATHITGCDHKPNKYDNDNAANTHVFHSTLLVHQQCECELQTCIIPMTFYAHMTFQHIGKRDFLGSATKQIKHLKRLPITCNVSVPDYGRKSQGAFS